MQRSSRTSQKFSKKQILIAVVVILVIGVVGGLVYARQDSKKNSDQQKSTVTPPRDDAGQTPAAQQPSTKAPAPAGYAVYEDKAAGYTFSYPATFGSFSKQSDAKGAIWYQSQPPSNDAIPGINSNAYFILRTHTTANPALVARKYGSTIQLQGGKWIVTTPSQYDTANKKGAEYKETTGKPIPSQNNNGVVVYTIYDGYEGIEGYTLVFVAGNKLHELEVPGFDDGTYGNYDDNVKPKDQAKYNEMLKIVRDSIQKL